MRCLIVIWLALGAATAHSEDIVEVLQRSQQMRLDAMHGVDAADPRVQVLRDSFDSVLRSVAPARAIELRVVQGDTVAETLLGRVVVVNVSLAALSEAGRLFVLAHELGHVAMGHQSQMGTLFQKWVPGPVLQAQTDAVAGRLGRDASGLAHQQEFSADAFALRTLCAMGHSRDEVLAVFLHLGLNRDTATHPGTAKRVAALRAAPLDAAHDGELALAH